MRYFIVLLFFLTGCSSLKFWGKGSSEEPSPQQQRKTAKAIEEFNRGTQFLDREDYKKAAQVFRKLLADGPTTALELIARYNLGLAYEGLGKCKSAASTFRHVIKSSGNDHGRLRAQALFRLSQSYECLGEDAKVISSLLDVRRRAKFLPDEVALAEVPARLASAYARMGNRQVAEKYFIEAERGIKQLGGHRRSVSEQKELLARTLYMMGKLDIKHFSAKASDRYLQSLEYTQKYLLASVEMNHEKWSTRSAEALLQNYAYVWDLIAEMKATDTDSRKVKRIKNQTVQSAINNIELLKKARFPDPESPPLVDTLFEKLNEKEKEFQAYLAGNLLGPELTKENKERFGLKRKGRLVTPKGKEK